MFVDVGFTGKVEVMNVCPSQVMETIPLFVPDIVREGPSSFTLPIKNLKTADLEHTTST